MTSSSLELLKELRLGAMVAELKKTNGRPERLCKPRI